MATRLEWVFRDLPFFVAFAVVLLIANAWCTTRRMSRALASCLFGCVAVGRDDLRHSLARPRLAASQCGRVPPSWVGTGNLRVVAPMNRPDVRAACVWAYVAYRMHVAPASPCRMLSFSAPCALSSASSPRARPGAETPCLACTALAVEESEQRALPRASRAPFPATWRHSAGSARRRVSIKRARAASRKCVSKFRRIALLVSGRLASRIKPVPGTAGTRAHCAHT